MRFFPLPSLLPRSLIRLPFLHYPLIRLPSLCSLLLCLFLNRLLSIRSTFLQPLHSVKLISLTFLFASRLTHLSSFLLPLPGWEDKIPPYDPFCLRKKLPRTESFPTAAVQIFPRSACIKSRSCVQEANILCLQPCNYLLSTSGLEAPSLVGNTFPGQKDFPSPPSSETT